MAFQIREGEFWIIETRWNRFCLPCLDQDPDPIFSQVPEILVLDCAQGWFLELPSICPTGEPAWTGPFQTEGEAALAAAELGAAPQDDTPENAFLQAIRMQRLKVGASSPAADLEGTGREQSR